MQLKFIWMNLKCVLSYAYLHSWDDRTRLSVPTLSARYCGVSSGMRICFSSSGRCVARFSTSLLTQVMVASNIWHKHQSVTNKILMSYSQENESYPINYWLVVPLLIHTYENTPVTIENKKYNFCNIKQNLRCTGSG